MHNVDEYLNKLRLHLNQNKNLDDKKLEDILAVFVARELKSGTRHKHILLPEKTDKNDLIEFLIDKSGFMERNRPAAGREVDSGHGDYADSCR